jgi:hypothetical protein
VLHTAVLQDDSSSSSSTCRGICSSTVQGSRVVARAPAVWPDTL